MFKFLGAICFTMNYEINLFAYFISKPWPIFMGLKG